MDPAAGAGASGSPAAGPGPPEARPSPPPSSSASPSPCPAGARGLARVCDLLLKKKPPKAKRGRSCRPPSSSESGGGGSESSNNGSDDEDEDDDEEDEEVSEVSGWQVPAGGGRRRSGPGRGPVTPPAWPALPAWRRGAGGGAGAGVGAASSAGEGPTVAALGRERPRALLDPAPGPQRKEAPPSSASSPREAAAAWDTARLRPPTRLGARVFVAWRLPLPGLRPPSERQLPFLTRFFRAAWSVAKSPGAFNILLVPIWHLQVYLVTRAVCISRVTSVWQSRSTREGIRYAVAPGFGPDVLV